MIEDVFLADDLVPVIFKASRLHYARTFNSKRLGVNLAVLVWLATVYSVINIPVIKYSL